jgi:hypothetical protein
MEGREILQERMRLLAQREWNAPAIKERFDKLVEEGIPKVPRKKEYFTSRREEILDLVQLRAEEYCYLTRNCARGSATALFEAFGIGSMEIIKGLAPFPGLVMTGGACGPITGGLMAIALFCCDDDLTNWQDITPYVLGREFLTRFEQTFGSILCPGVQERILGRYFDPLASWENQEEFLKSGGREKCPLAPGMGARLAAEIIIDHMEK